MENDKGQTAGDAEGLGRRLRELAALLALEERVGRSRSVDEVVGSALDGVAEAVAPHLALLFLREGRSLLLRGVTPEPPGGLAPFSRTHEVGQCLCGVAARARAPVFSAELCEDPRCTWTECKAAGFRAFAALPLIGDGELLGVLGLASRDQRRFSEQAPFLEALARSVSVKLHNGVLYDRLRRKSEELEAVNGQLRAEVAERAASEERLRRAQEELLQARKMEALGTLAGGVAHDFNNLLQAVSGYAELLRREAPPEGRETRRLEGILRAASRGEELVRSLLAFGRRAPPDRRRLDLNRALQDTVDLLERTIPKMIRIELSLGEGLAPVLADRVQLTQVILNLGTNARDAMPRGGTLSVETRTESLDAAFCEEHPGARPGEYVLLRLSDTGQGMSPEVAAQIFEPFFTTKEFGAGTGLGLSTAYGIVLAHDGFIRCETAPGRGTAFSVYWPAASGVGEPNTPLEPALQGPPLGGGERVLVVDDDPEVRGLALTYLGELGYPCRGVGSAEEALELLAADPGAADLVVLDLGLPGMGGHACLGELRRRHPACPVLVATGYGSTERRSAEEAGAAAVLSKPFRLPDLAQALRRIAGR